MWGLGIRLRNFPTPGWQNILLLKHTFTNLPWVHRQGVNSNLLPTWTRLWELFMCLDQAVSLKYGLDSDKTAELDALMGLILLLLKSGQGFYSWLGPFLITLNSSFLLASNFVNYGSRLGCKCQAKKVSLKVYLLFFKSSNRIWIPSFLPLHNIILNVASKKNDQSIRISHWHWSCCSCHFGDGAAYFLYQNHRCLYYELSTRFNNYLTRFMTFWTKLFLNRLVI